jgi:hypothetical protein
MRPVTGLVLAFALAGGAGAAEAQAPPLAVAFEAGTGVVRVGAVLAERTVEEAAISGLPVRVHLRVELWRSALFDRLVAAETRSAVILHDPLADRFRIAFGNGESSRTVADWRSVREQVERAWPTRLSPRGRGRHYFTATLEVETLALSDLAELQRWMRGELQPAVEGQGSVPAAVGTGLRRLLVRILRLPVRRYEARSGYFAAPAG